MRASLLPPPARRPRPLPVASRPRPRLRGLRPVACPLRSLGLLALAVVQMGGCHWSSGRGGRPAPQVVSTDERRIRVRLDRHTPEFSLRVRGPCLLDNDHGTSLLEPLAELEESAVRPDPASPEGLVLGGTRLPGPVVRVLPNDDGTIWYKDRPYRGYLVIKRNGDGFLVINVVDIESYLRGVLQGELPRYFHPEAFRAQAIVSRTYALYQRYVHGPERSWDVTADTSSQVYRGVDGEGTKANRAVDATAGIVLAWDSPNGRKIFCTYFSSTCGGMNQDVRNVKGGELIPPLVGGVPCKYCSSSEWYRWPTVALTPKEITEAVKPWLIRGGYTHAEDLDTIRNVKVVRETPDGRAIRLRLIDKNGLTVDMRAEDFRLLIQNGTQIKSTHFDIAHTESKIVFRNGRGYGHGIGMCQYGAHGMAQRGIKAGKILQHYYPGCVLVKAY